MHWRSTYRFYFALIAGSFLAFGPSQLTPICAQDTPPSQPIAEPTEKPKAAPQESKPAESKPAESKPAESEEGRRRFRTRRSTETRPEGETKPTETKAAEAKPEPAKPEPAKPEPAKPEEAKAASDSAKGEVKPVETKTLDTKQPKSSDDRLERIENQLLELNKLMQSLKAPKESSAAKASSNSSSSSTSESKSTESKADGSSSKSWNGDWTKDWTKGIRWRNIGPANMGGRIVDMTVYEAEPNTWWAATASGGLLKTTNNGISFQIQFDKESTVSIGAVAVAQTDPNIVWVGTGENNPRNSVSYGDGVYKSTDGGKTWKNMGLNKTYQIGEVLIHPKDPNTVYVGALGRLYGPNEERGVFKTTDGGNTWERVFYLDDRTGVLEMQFHPADPNTLLITAWERLRDGFDSWPGTEVPIPDGYDGYDPIRKWGPGSGIYKTTDAGKSWKKLTKGLPTSELGRIGIDWYRKDPNIIFAVVDCENIAKGPAPISVLWGGVGQDVDGKAVITQVYPKSPAEKGGLKVGDVVQSLEDKPVTSFDDILTAMKEMKGGDKLSLKIQRGGELKDMDFTLAARTGAAGASNQSTIWFGGLGEDDEKGVKIVRVVPDSPSGKAGIQPDDVITSFDGARPESWEGFIAAVSAKKAGDKVKVQLEREGQTKDLEIVLENRPAPEGTQQQQAPTSRVFLGIQGQNASVGGALLTEITKDAPGEKAGLMKGDIIKSANGKPLENYRALTELLRTANPGDKLKVTVARATELKEMEIELKERPAPTRPYTASLGGQAANVQDIQGAKGFEYGGIYKSVDGGESWTRINSVHSRPMYFSVIRVDPNDDQKLYLLGVSQYQSQNGGLSFEANFGRGVHADGHALWVDPKDGKHMIIGVDGGVYKTHDRGNRWDHLNTNALGQFYHVAIAPKYPYYVYGGLQDNGSWGGPAISLNGSGPVNEDWISVGGGDGFMCRVDPNDPDLVYFTSQNGAMRRRHLKTGEQGSIRPNRVEGAPAVRFNWNTPFILSNANSRVFYAAGNYVLRSLDRGNNLEIISPEITLTKRGSATALSESPRNPNVLYVGTDDGGLWMTKDGGKTWNDIRGGMELPAPRWVATIEASRFAEGRVYVALDGHRSNDDEPYVFVSEDFGKTWKSLRNNLPWGSTRCLREDPFNENVLLLGTEFAVYASGNRGEHWNSLNSNLPTVAVHEFAFHPNNGEVVAATHGRSLWIADITPLHQFAAKQVAEPHLYKPTTAIRWKREPSRGGTNRAFVGENPPSGAQIYYSLPTKAKEVTVKIANSLGQVVREIRASPEVGLHRVAWDLSMVMPRERSEPAGAGGEGRRGGGAEGRGGAGEGRRGGGFGAFSLAGSGTYKVTLVVDGKEQAQELKLVNDPNVAGTVEISGHEAEYDVWMGDVSQSDGEEEEEEEKQGPNALIDDTIL